MTENQLVIADRQIGEGSPCLIIAEAGINHNGDIRNAIMLVRKASECRADIVKFQTFSASTLMSRAISWPKIASITGDDEDLYSFADRVALSPEDHYILQNECKEMNIHFLSTACTPEEVDFLEEIGVSAYKIASGDLDNIPLLKHVAGKQLPILLSTGMSTLAEVDRALDAIYGAGGNDIVLMHCVSLYPLESQYANLRAIDTMRVAFNLPVGFSDHSIGNTIAVAAVARGACVIEKHFTLDRAMVGPDHSCSIDPAHLVELIHAIRDVEKALGTGRKTPMKPELESKSAMRRSIVGKQRIPAGIIVTQEMLSFKRPGTGISPADLKLVIGRCAKRDIKVDELLSLEKHFYSHDT
ncbi:MAG: N-acetylneuraminate synthase [Planctomycetota bacterium]|nr:MAG: N-acetylneuraminate synthase [Planctomycetota bacterium]